MIQDCDQPTDQSSNSPGIEENVPALKFGRDNSFQAEVRRRVDNYFRTTGRRRRDCWQMYLKTGLLLAGFAASFVLLVFVAQTWWQALPLAVFLGLATAAIGFNIQHDGGHRAVSDRPWVNKLMAMTLDLTGGSSYLWHWKHGVFHHTYANVTGHDTDVDLGLLGRLTPHQKRRKFHRWQHYYLWPFYGFLAIKWQLWDDFHDAIVGKIGGHRVPRPWGWELALFLGGKAIFLAVFLGLPLLFHPIWAVALYYGVTTLVLGTVLGIVFQLAHCVEEAEFPVPRESSGRMDSAWGVHQVETTVDFARSNRPVAWLLGGLNFQIEHHLFPRICHINYPALSKLVEATCREFGVRYTAHASVWAGLVSHFRWLRRMGRPNLTG